MHIVIIGAGEIGLELARRLAARSAVVVVDKRPEALAGLELLPDTDPAPIARLPAKGLVGLVGDGSSRLVLKRLREAERRLPLLAASPDDEVNLEIGRLGRELGFDPILLVQNRAGSKALFDGGSWVTVPRTALLVDHLERTLKASGAVVPVGIGLGRGELLEIRLQRTSPILHRPLRELDPHRWRVAAIFRQDQLIVPTGESTLEPDDRVLLVGDPEVLPAVSEYLRLGTPEFPRPYGPNVVSLEPGGSDQELGREATALACACGAASVVRGFPGAPQVPSGADEDLLSAPACKGSTGQATFPLADGAPGASAALALEHHAGVVLARPARPGAWQRLRIGLGARAWDAELCDALRVPVLFGRQTMPYRRLLVTASGSRLDRVGAELAIDVARQLGASLTALHVAMPVHLTGQDEQAGGPGPLVPIARLAQLFGLKLESLERQGNPIHAVLEEASRHDLLVLARRQRRRDSPWNPDVALRIARAARCSTLVITVPAAE
ncbi:MAG TPA: TrkA C-terminal domain-containing protein [Myxococcota bacterium]|nr:TrkA C-terminal domain-containing protein [Myxococcota bacterium]HRY92484.1 TrkA C-terminal domain-containing protein [Myxococcota bacterium]HSA23321.1 TrkA C-terminal domain-containing protein [Myxococcota bacterium]